MTTFDTVTKTQLNERNAMRVLVNERILLATVDSRLLSKGVKPHK